MDGDLIDFWRGEQVPAEQIVRGVLAEVASHAEELGCAEELGVVGDLLGDNTGAHRQLRHFDRSGDLDRPRPRDRARTAVPDAAARAVRRLFSWSCPRQAPS